MIKGVGADLIRGGWLEQAVQRSGHRFLDRAFCGDELQCIRKHVTWGRESG